MEAFWHGRLRQLNAREIIAAGEGDKWSEELSDDIQERITALCTMCYATHPLMLSQITQ